jgi:hypothetical protein
MDEADIHQYQMPHKLSELLEAFLCIAKRTKDVSCEKNNRDH